jgi:transketolase
MRKQFRDTIMNLALTDERIALLFGDVSVYLFNDFSKTYPERFYNLGICENTIISTGAGLSKEGFYPFMHTIAPFITERSYEQIKMDLCYNGFGGNIVSCGASFDYAWDGPSHHSYTDLAILRLLPNMEVIQLGSRKEVDVLIRSQYNNGLPTYFRLSDHPHNIDMDVEFGKGVMLKDSKSSVTVITGGPVLSNVMEACRDLAVNLLYFHTIKPIDRELINRYKNTKILVFSDAFGLAEAVGSIGDIRVSYFGMKDSFFYSSYGKLDDARVAIGLDIETIRKTVKGILDKN